MFYDPSTEKELSAWLIRTLEPIGDADPEVLTAYIMALLKREATAPALRTIFIEQLEDFLHEENVRFVDEFMRVLQTKEYLRHTSSSSKPPKAPSPPPPQTNALHKASIDRTPPPIPSSSERLPASSQQASKSTSNTATSGQKRRLDDPEDQTGQRKGPRLAGDSMMATTQFDSGDGASGSRMKDGPQTNGQTMINGSAGGPYNQRPRAPKGICYNYHNNGYCPRGALCPFTHGDDPVVANPMLFQPPNGQASGMTFIPNMMGMNFPMPFMMNPNQMNMNNRMPQMGGNRRGRGGRFNQRRDDDAVMVDVTPNQIPTPMFTRSEGDSSGMEQMEGVDESLPPAAHSQQSFMQIDSTPAFDPGHGPPFQRGRGGRRGTGFNSFQSRNPVATANGKGVFSGEHPAMDVNENADGAAPRTETKTLVVEKIPEEHLKLGAVNDWFARFGTVTNVAIDPRSSKALVSFSTQDEARAAWKSEDAVFGNRFVKVFWHRPMGGKGQAGAKALAASAPLVKHLSNTQNVPPSLPQPPKPSSSKPTSSAGNLLESQIAEQKELFAQLSSASPEEKKTIMARLRKLGEEMKPPSSLASATPHASQEQSLKDQLDRDLEMHSTNDVPDEKAGGAGGAHSSTSSALQAKLASLRAEASRLGVDTNSVPPSYRGTTPRGRGRARGGGYSGRGRGGPSMRSNKTLDLRPKKLNIKGIGSEEARLTAVREWYEVTGELESFQAMPNGDVQALFRTRQGAEQALAKGSNIRGVGPVQISWQVDGPPPNGIHPVAEGLGPSNGVKMDISSHVAGELGPTSGDAFMTSTEDEEDYYADDTAGAWA